MPIDSTPWPPPLPPACAGHRDALRLGIRARIAQVLRYGNAVGVGRRIERCAAPGQGVDYVGRHQEKCACCGNGFIGRSNASFCSPACRQRVHRGNRDTKRNASAVTVLAPKSRRRPRRSRSAEAEAVLRSLDEQLALVGQERGEQLEWSPQERFQLDLLAAEIDRTVDLALMYEACCDDVKLRVKLSAELRLLRQSMARMIASIKTELPERPSPTTRKARRAAMLVGRAAVVMTVPQRKRGGSRDAGLYIPGVYRALLDYERARYERRSGEPVVIDGVEIGKKTLAGVDEHGKDGFFLYSRRDALNSLEAGATVGLAVGRIADALWQRDRERDPQASRTRLPFGRSWERVQVSPDDQLVPVVREGD